MLRNPVCLYESYQLLSGDTMDMLFSTNGNRESFVIPKNIMEECRLRLPMEYRIAVLENAFNHCYLKLRFICLYMNVISVSLIYMYSFSCSSLMKTCMSSVSLMLRAPPSGSLCTRPSANQTRMMIRAV